MHMTSLPLLFFLSSLVKSPKMLNFLPRSIKPTLNFKQQIYELSNFKVLNHLTAAVY